MKMKIKKETKQLRKINNNLCFLNSFYSKKLEEMKQEALFLEDLERRINNRFYVIKRFLIFKNYKDTDFQEFLNLKLVDEEIDLETKGKIKTYFSHFLKGPI